MVNKQQAEMSHLLRRLVFLYWWLQMLLLNATSVWETTDSQSIFWHLLQQNSSQMYSHNSIFMLQILRWREQNYAIIRPHQKKQIYCQTRTLLNILCTAKAHAVLVCLSHQMSVTAYINRQWITLLSVDMCPLSKFNRRRTHDAQSTRLMMMQPTG